MVPYSEYHLSERLIKAIKENQASRRITQYIRDNGVEPPQDIVQGFYEVSEEKLENYRKIHYGLAMADKSGDNVPYEPGGNTGGTIDTGGTENTGSTIDTGTTEESGNTTPSPQFVLTLAETPCVVDDGEWAVYAMGIIRNGIMNGDLLDYTSASITLNGNNGNSITITDLTKSYFIPEGQYTAEGWIGRPYVKYYGDHNNGTCIHDKTYVTVNGSFVINNEYNAIQIQICPQDAVIISDKPFRYSYKSRNNGNMEAEKYNGVNYLFVTNGCRQKGASYVDYMTANYKTVHFDIIEYTINTFEGGGVYFYGGKTEIPSNSGGTNQLDYDEFVRLTYNVTDIYGETRLFHTSACCEGIGYMEIDGVAVQPTDTYEFKTLGTHKVDVLLKDSSKMAPLRFTDCPSLREIVIPASVDSLKNEVFNDCNGIEKITCLRTTPPAVDIKWNAASNDFKDMNTGGVLYVLNGCKNTYLQSGWLKYYSEFSFYNISTYGWTIKELSNDED